VLEELGTSKASPISRCFLQSLSDFRAKPFDVWVIHFRGCLPRPLSFTDIIARVASDGFRPN
jgi:hypothetical protein